MFSSIESAEKLHINGISNAQEDFDPKRMKKFNFFTSRFFTAFDMILNFKPSVLIVSDVKKVSHSAVDPFTDVIQIIGRARNGVTEVTHITNLNPEMKGRSATEVREYLSGVRDAYFAIKNLRDTTNKIGAFDALNDALNVVAFSDYINEYDDSINHFMIDQDVHFNRIKGYYTSSDNLLQAYCDTNRFQCCLSIEEYNLEDKTIDKLQQGLSEKEVMRVVSEALESHFQASEGVYFLTPDHTLHHLIRTHNRIYNYYRVLGIEKIRALEYKPNLIERAFEQAEETLGTKYFQLLASLKLIFKRVKRANTAKIKWILRHYFNKYNVTSLKPTVVQLSQWFEIHRTTDGYKDDGVEVKIWVIGNPRF